MRSYRGISRLQARLAPFASGMVVFVATMILCGTGTVADGSRTVRLYNIHTKETLTSTYKKNGRYVPAEMEKINWIFRDWRKNEATTMEPQLIDLLWEVHSELGSAEPIHIISGYRSRGTNDMLRKTVGGQASQSRHILGRAADVHFPDVPVKNLRYSALIREKGGVGYYPTSAIPFVHMDIDRVRSWPRLPRAELALLFPSGRTQHVPTDGVPITKADVREARAAHKELALQLASFHDLRQRPRLPFQTASFTPPSLPQLLSPPRLIERPAAAVREVDRERLARLIATDPAPQLLVPPRPVTRRPAHGQPVHLASYEPGRSSPNLQTPLYSERSVVAAPEYDEEHPDELSYRPFPIAPFLTATASADDPALADMVHPHLGRILETLGQENVAPPMRLRPGVHAAERLWAHQFTGGAVDFSALLDADVPGGGASLPNRRVATQRQ